MFWFKKRETESKDSSRFPTSPHPLRGYTNFGLYEVRGMNPKTNCQNKKVIEALSSDDALDRAKRIAGLISPITVQEVQRPMATERQIAYGSELGLKILPNISMIDASAMICREHDGDDPNDTLTKSEWDAACQAGVIISALCGHTFYFSAMKNAKRVE